MKTTGSAQKASKAAARNARRRKQEQAIKEQQREDHVLKLVGEWTRSAKGDPEWPYWEQSFSLKKITDSAGCQIEFVDADGTRGVLTLADGWFTGAVFRGEDGERCGSIRLQLQEDSDTVHSNFKAVPFRAYKDGLSEDSEDFEGDLIERLVRDDDDSDRLVRDCNGDFHKAVELMKEEKAREKNEEAEANARALEEEIARKPWGQSTISRRMPSASQVQRSVEAWSALVKRRTSVFDAYAKAQGAQDQARFLVVWPQAVLYLGVSERVRTMSVCSGFRVALLKSIDSMASIEFGHGMRGDPIYRSTDIFEAVAVSLVTSPSVRTAELNTDMAADTVLRHIVKTCPKLEALDIRGACPTDHGSMALISKTCRTLRSLKFSFPFVSKCQQSNTWSHAAIDALAESPSALLTEVAIEGFSSAIACRGDYDPFIERWRDESGELELGAVALSKLLRGHGANLLFLSLADWPVSEEMGLEIGRRCPNLQVLNISSPCELCDTSSLTPAGLSAIAEGCSRLKAMSLRQADRAISEDSLVALSKNCQDLAELDLSGKWDQWASVMHTVTDKVMQAAASCGMAKLAVLDLYMTATTDATLFALSMSCPALRRIDLSTSASDDEGEGFFVLEDPESRLFTDEGVAALAQGCRHLELLNIHMCLQLTDKAILELAEHCKQLRYLDMSGGNMGRSKQADEAGKNGLPTPHLVTRYTDASMLALKVGCPMLRLLNVAHCPRIRSGCLEDLEASCPGLEIETTRTLRQSCLELLSDNRNSQAFRASDSLAV